MPIIFYHADCPDGFGAAYAAWRHFGAAARYRPVHHGDTWDASEIRGETVYILDFSFAPAALTAMAAQAQAVVQLDHHATARHPWENQLSEHEGGLETFRHPDLPLTLHFDLQKSGARLAWEYFHPGEPLPVLLAHIEDMDLWRFALPDTRAISRALRLQDYDFLHWHDLIERTVHRETPDYQQLVTEGWAIERFMATEISRLAESRLVTSMTLKGEAIDALQAVRHGQPVIADENGSWQAISGLLINAGSLFASELGNRLAEMSDTFGATWQLDGQGNAKVSLRACGKVNVAAMAERYGGGGHPNAAGFRLPIQDFLALLR